MTQVLVPEIGEVREHHRREPDLRLAAGERVAEARRGAERGGPGGEDTGLGKVIGGDLEEFSRVRQAVDLVEDDALPAVAFKERLRVLQLPPHARQLAVVVAGVGERLAKHALADPAHSHEPDHRAAPPRLRDLRMPKGPDDHTSMVAFGSTKRKTNGGPRNEAGAVGSRAGAKRELPLLRIGDDEQIWSPAGLDPASEVLAGHRTHR